MTAPEWLPRVYLDANPIISAIMNRCRYFVSGDADYKRMPDGMTLVRPDPASTKRTMIELA